MKIDRGCVSVRWEKGTAEGGREGEQTNIARPFVRWGEREREMVLAVDPSTVSQGWKRGITPPK